MKTTRFIVLFVLTVFIASTTAYVLKFPASRANLNVGSVLAGDKLLHRQYLYRQPIPNTIQSEDLVYRGNITTRITAVQAIEVGYIQYATPWIISGGVGYNNVTLRVQSARSYGYYYLVDIWGR